MGLGQFRRIEARGRPDGNENMVNTGKGFMWMRIMSEGPPGRISFIPGIQEGVSV